MELDLHGRESIFFLLKLVTYSQNSHVYECFFNMENKRSETLEKIND